MGHFLPVRRGLLLAAMAALLAGGAVAQTPTKAQPTLRIEPLDITTAKGVYHFKVEIAETDKTREAGLMFRKSLAPDRGMLFDFKTPRANIAFWMKNTLIPLDLLYIGADGRVVSIAHDARPMDETPIFAGGVVLGVLELAGGRAAEIDAEPGDKVRQRIFHP
ncbi:MAG: DUF192 domain-containing protein [Caulobacteraceae bacterium]